MNKTSISKINPDSAGIDIGTEYIFIGIEDKDVVSFPTLLTATLKQLNIYKRIKLLQLLWKPQVFTGSLFMI